MIILERKQTFARPSIGWKMKETEVNIKVWRVRVRREGRAGQTRKPRAAEEG